MDEKEEGRNNRRTLKALLDAAGYTSKRIAETAYEVTFGGNYRDWDVRLAVANGWLAFTIYFFALPPIGSIRTALYERVLELNDVLSASKFTKSKETLTLDLQYRAQHADAEAIQNLIGLLIATCEEHYPELFRIVSGDETLSKLEGAFTRPSVSESVE